MVDQKVLPDRHSEAQTGKPSSDEFVLYHSNNVSVRKVLVLAILAEYECLS